MTMNSWYFLFLVPSVLWLMHHHARKNRLSTFLDNRGMCHNEKFWVDRYPQYPREALMKLISELSGVIGVSPELIDPGDKLSEITVNDVLSSDELDDAAILLVRKYGVDKKKLGHIVTVDDYIQSAMENGMR